MLCFNNEILIFGENIYNVNKNSSIFNDLLIC